MKFIQQLTFYTFYYGMVSTTIAQQPDGLDPGNPRGTEGTINFWDDPGMYIPSILIIILLLVLFWLGRKRKRRGR